MGGLVSGSKLQSEHQQRQSPESHPPIVLFCAAMLSKSKGAGSPEVYLTNQQDAYNHLHFYGLIMEPTMIDYLQNPTSDPVLFLISIHFKYRCSKLDFHKLADPTRICSQLDARLPRK